VLVTPSVPARAPLIRITKIMFNRLKLSTKLTLLLALAAFAVIMSIAFSASMLHGQLMEDRVDKLRAVVQSFARAARVSAAISCGISFEATDTTPTPPSAITGNVTASSPEKTRKVSATMLMASATCVINFDEAEGYLIGEAHKGMRAMFTT